MKRWKVLSLFVLLSAIWGLSFVAVKAGVSSVPPVFLAAVRFDIAGILLLLYAMFMGRRIYPISHAEIQTAVVGGLFFVAVHHALLFIGQQYITSSVAGVVIATDPILAAALSYFLLPQRSLRKHKLMGIFLGLIGISIVANPDVDQIFSADVVGIGLVFLSALSFALGGVLTEYFQTDAPLVSVQAWMMVVGAPLLHLISYLHPAETASAANWSLSAIVGLLYLATVSGCVGYLIYFKLLDVLGAAETNLIGYVAPCFAALGGWVLLGERLVLSTVIGFIVIFFGFVLIKLRELRSIVVD